MSSNDKSFIKTVLGLGVISVVLSLLFWAAIIGLIVWALNATGVTS